MSSRRLPLANNPNAANSPYRHAGLKRARAPSHDAQDERLERSPPKKKQLVDQAPTGRRRPQNVSLEDADAKVFTERPANSQSSSFQRKLAAARNGRQTAQKLSPEENDRHGKEMVRRWRRNYSLVFPNFVFYFESLPSELALQASREIAALGAREEKFFSRSVTNVVTTRPVPTGPWDPTPSDGRQVSRQAPSVMSSTQSKTIDPSLLVDKAADLQAFVQQTRNRYAQESTQQRRTHGPLQDLDCRRQHQTSNDTLYKARELGMKIWTWEKFERVMKTMFNNELDDDEPESHPPRPSRNALVSSKPQKDVDLQRLLKHERQGLAERAAPWQDIIPFRGIFLYVHDMDERVKPIMVREYSKPANADEGDWPMLHSVSKGRCPFVEEPAPNPKKEVREQDRGKCTRGKVAKQNVAVTKTEPHVSQQHIQAGYAVPQESTREGRRTRSSTRSPQKPVLGDASEIVNRPAPTNMAAPISKPSDPPTKLARTSSNFEAMPPMLGSTHASFKGISRNPGGEPLASGLRPNITSAVQSQMISSTAAAPGARVGTTKQMHHLNRQVLEKQSGLSTNSVSSSLNMNDVRAAINTDRNPAQKRSTRQKLTAVMAKINEDETLSEDEEKNYSNAKEGQLQRRKKKQAAKREPKPGYCENCRDKYDDFTEHIVSKKHKKLAMDPEIWAELDELLEKLVRR